MTHIRQRRDTASNWTSVNPTLMLGEAGWVTDVEPKQVKLGDGVTPWNSLDYAIIPALGTTGQALVVQPDGSLGWNDITGTTGLDDLAVAGLVSDDTSLTWDAVMTEIFAKALNWIIVTDPDIGMVDDGVTVNTTGLANLKAALNVDGAPRTVYWPHKTNGIYLLNGDLNVENVLHMGPGYPNQATNTGPDTTRSSVWLKWTSGSMIDADAFGSVFSGIRFENLGFWCATGASNLINVGVGNGGGTGNGMTRARWRNCYFYMASKTSRLLYAGLDGSNLYPRNLWDIEFRDCSIYRAVGSTVPVFDITGGYGHNGIRIINGQWDNHGVAIEPFFKAQAAPGTGIGPIFIDSIIGERNAGGLVHVYSPYGGRFTGITDNDNAAASSIVLNTAITTAGGAISSIDVTGFTNDLPVGSALRINTSDQVWYLTAPVAAALAATVVTLPVGDSVGAAQIPAQNQSAGALVYSGYQASMFKFVQGAGIQPTGVHIDSCGDIDTLNKDPLMAVSAYQVEIGNGFDNHVGPSILNGVVSTSGGITTRGAPKLSIGTNGANAAPVFFHREASVDFPSVTAGGLQNVDVTIPGVAIGDHVTINPNSLPTGTTALLVIRAAVTAANTVTVQAVNPSASAIDPAARQYNITVMHY